MIEFNDFARGGTAPSMPTTELRLNSRVFQMESNTRPRTKGTSSNELSDINLSLRMNKYAAQAPSPEFSTILENEGMKVGEQLGDEVIKPV